MRQWAGRLMMAWTMAGQGRAASSPSTEGSTGTSRKATISRPWYSMVEVKTPRLFTRRA